jgi:hypothetical protein
MTFNAPVYALDVLLPIIDLGQQDSWQPTGIALYAYWTFIIVGWVLTSAFVAGITGIFKRDWQNGVAIARTIAGQLADAQIEQSGRQEFGCRNHASAHADERMFRARIVIRLPAWH